MIVNLAWKNIWRNRRRTFITIFAISFAVLFAVLMRSVQAGMEEQMIVSIIKNNIGYIQIHSNGYWEEQTLDNGLQSDELPTDKILELENVVSIENKLQSGTIASTGDISRGSLIIGYQEGVDLPEIVTRNITQGDYPNPNRAEILMGEELAEYLNAEIGDTIIFLGGGYHGTTAAGLFVLSGLIDMHMPELNGVVTYMDLKSLQDFIGAPNLVTSIQVDVEDPDLIEKTKLDLENLLGSKYEVMTWYEMNPELKQTLDTSSAKGWIMNFILYMIISFVMFGTIIMATQERKYELGVMLAIGMKKWKTMLMIGIETIIISLIGALTGIGIVTPIAYYFHFNPIMLQGEEAELIEQYGFEAIIPFSINPSIAINHASIVLVISIFLVVYPIYQIKKMKPIEAMKL